MSKWDIQIDSRSKAMPVPRKKISELAAFIVKRERHKAVDLEIVIVSRREIARINREFLSHAGATDVISFDLTNETDRRSTWLIVVCDEVAIAEAKKRNLSPQRELLLYITHGLLHQMGYDDQEPAEAERMAARQEKLLNDFLN